MAFSLGFWLLLQTVDLLGACITRFFSPSSTDSTSTLSKLPSDDVGTAFVDETGELAGLGFGLLAGIGLSPKRMLDVLNGAGRRRRCDNTARRVEGNIIVRGLLALGLVLQLLVK